MAARSARRPAQAAPLPPPPVDDGRVDRDPRRNPRPGDRLKVHGGYLLQVLERGRYHVLAHSDPDADPWRHEISLHAWRKHTLFADVLVLAEPQRVKPPRPRRGRK